MDDFAPRDPELALSLVYVAPACRPALGLLWMLDERLGAIAGGANPQLAAIKLAWWRDSLERLDTAPVPAEPLLAAIATRLLPAGISGARLALIATGWDRLIAGDEDDRMMLTDHARERGASLFAIAAGLLGDPTADVAAAGAGWALATIAPRLPAGQAVLARAIALECLAALPARPWPRRLRALGLLALLARADVRAGGIARHGSPRRMLRALWHGMSGR